MPSILGLMLLYGVIFAILWLAVWFDK
jgi:hypothetical protein